MKITNKDRHIFKTQLENNANQISSFKKTEIYSFLCRTISVLLPKAYQQQDVMVIGVR